VSVVNSLGSTASPTRGLFAGGYDSAVSNVISYITIASLGNSQDFGDLTVATTNYPAGAASNTRALFAGGNSGRQNVIAYVTIASTGNATDFGDLTVAVSDCASNSNKILAVFAGGFDGSGSGRGNQIDKVTIASTGNASDFGDLTAELSNFGGCSNGHGGIA